MDKHQLLQNPRAITDLGWSKRLVAVSTVSILGLLAICLIGGYVLYKQSKATQETLRTSQACADAAVRAQLAILIMGKAEVQLVNATDPDEQRAAAVLAIQASSTIDENIQRLNSILTGSPKVEELAQSLQEIGPMKIAIVRSVRANAGAEAKAQFRNMQPYMSRIEQISRELVQEGNERLQSAVVEQGKETNSILRWLAGMACVCIMLAVFAGRGLALRTMQLDRARRESEIFINCVPSILIGANHQGVITRWNRSASDVFGLTNSEVLGKPLYDCGVEWSNCHLESEMAIWTRLNQARRLDDISFKKGNETRILGLTVNPIQFGEGREAEFLITGADITERRVMERELRQGQKLEAIGQLAAGIAHEINTPVQYSRDNVTFLQQSWDAINEILSLAQLMAMETVVNGKRPSSVEDFESRCIEVELDFLQKEVPTALAQSLEGLERVAKIVRAMKEFSHPGSTEKTPLNLNRAIESTIEVAKNEWKYVADVTTDFDEALPLVSCFASELNQVILNLLVNASHAVGDVIKESQGKGMIVFKTRHADSWVEIQIRDSGKGIPEELSNKVFEPFFTTKEVGKGTGQGLALAYSVVVKKHAGKIWFESTSGKGTTFFIRLPLTVPAQTHPPATAAAAN